MRWFVAWARLRLGDRRGAQAALARLEGGPLADAAFYWEARLAASAARAAELDRRSIAAAGDGWYGWLARARLARRGEAAPPPALADPRPVVLPGGAAGAQLVAAAALLGLGWREAALAELDDLARRGPSAAAPAIAELAADAGEAELAFRVTRDLVGTTRRSLRWLYPDPMPSLLAARAASTGVDPDLLRAVIRRESGFRADARSVAGAIGLLQLVPATASRLGLLVGLAGDPAARLAEPDVNLTLGAHYLGLLLERFGDPAPALAAYNAGPTAVAGWARARAGQPLDEWVESLPYRETRGYLKAVLSARQVYRRLGGLPADLDPERPVPAPAEGAAF
jgi:soluble lytic murein transglycosylase